MDATNNTGLAGRYKGQWTPGSMELWTQPQVLQVGNRDSGHLGPWGCGHNNWLIKFKISITSALNEIGHGLKKLQDEGWKPRRTIVLASWGAEV